MLGVLIWWAVDAHKWFKGPKVNIDHQMLGREGNVVEGKVEGKEDDNDSGDSSSGSITKRNAQHSEHGIAKALG